MSKPSNNHFNLTVSLPKDHQQIVERTLRLSPQLETVNDLVLSINPQVWLENSLRQRFPGVEWDITISCVAGSKGDPQ